MTRKIIIAGACILALAAVTYVCSGIALMERGYTAFGGEILIPVIGFCLWVAVRTVKDIRKGWKNGKS